LWHLGYPDQALQKNQEALALVEEQSQPFNRAYALVCAAKFHLLRREEPLARACAEEAMALSTEQGFPYWSANGLIYGGRTLAEHEQGGKGVEQLHQGLAVMQAIGIAYSQPYYLALLAEAYQRDSRLEAGLAALAEALAIVHNTGERTYKAELYRLKGVLSLQMRVHRHSSTVEAEAETYFLKALEIARRQQAKSLELRATTSLARLWQQQGKNAEAHKMLSEIYGWFTEGFDTKDLQEAKALLEELS